MNPFKPGTHKKKPEAKTYSSEGVSVPLDEVKPEPKSQAPHIHNFHPTQSGQGTPYCVFCGEEKPK